MMVSGYLCEKLGNLALDDTARAANAKLPIGEQLDVTDSRVIIYPSSKEKDDNYWNAKQMLEQVLISFEFTA